jgi:RNA polymerase sigma-70 factor (ECF subfamily)
MAFGMMEHKKDIYLSLMDEYSNKILRLCFAYLDDRSYIDDIFQDVMLAVWTGLDKFRNESGYGTWIYRITVNTIFLFNRSERRRKMMFENVNITSVAIAEFEAKIQEEENFKIMYQAISHLAELDRMMIALYLEKLSYEVIGSILGISKNLVGVRLNRIKEKIRNQMKESSK